MVILVEHALLQLAVRFSENLNSIICRVDIMLWTPNTLHTLRLLCCLQFIVENKRKGRNEKN